jgi:hypothetical protein
MGPRVKKAVFVSGGMLLLGIAYVLFLHPFINPPLSTWWSVRTLSAAKTPEDFHKAVGYYGNFLPLKDGSWVAIRYRDNHAMALWSRAVVRDSGGWWFWSDHHFCGAFMRRNIEHIEKMQKLEREMGGTEEQIAALGSRSDVWQLSQSPTLDTARKKLLEMGFRRFRD